MRTNVNEWDSWTRDELIDAIQSTTIDRDRALKEIERRKLEAPPFFDEGRMDFIVSRAITDEKEGTQSGFATGVCHGAGVVVDFYEQLIASGKLMSQ